jgi:hypothetical protein
MPMFAAIYRGVGYKVLPTETRGTWSWSVDLPHSAPRSGKAKGLSAAASAAKRVIVARSKRPL